MDINVRCPHCKEALAISDHEVDLPVSCPVCRRAFVWGKILEAKEKEKQAKRERLRQIRVNSQARRQQLLEQRKQQIELRAQKAREAAEREAAALREIKWHCAECNKGLCELDFNQQTAFWDNDAKTAYCRTHVPAWLYDRGNSETREREFRGGRRRQTYAPATSPIYGGLINQGRPDYGRTVTRRVLIVVVVGTLVVLVGIAIGGRNRSRDTEKRSYNSSPEPKEEIDWDRCAIGEERRLVFTWGKNGGKNITQVPVMLTPRDYDALIDGIIAKDAIGIEELLDRGFVVNNYTKVLIIGYEETGILSLKPGAIKIRVLEGEYAGMAGWVSREWIQR